MADHPHKRGRRIGKTSRTLGISGRRQGAAIKAAKKPAKKKPPGKVGRAKTRKPTTGRF